MSFLKVDFADYRESDCYKTEHLQWIKNHPQFVPYRCHHLECTYFEVMRELYTARKILYSNDRAWDPDTYVVKYGESGTLISNRAAYEYFMKDKQYVDYCFNKQKAKGIVHKFFVTLNFNHNTFNPKRCLEIVKRFPKYEKWFKDYVCKFENYRRDKETQRIYEHPHCHMILELQCSISPKKLAEKIFAIRDIKNFIDAINFVQIDRYGDHSIDYMNGVKIENKMDCIAKDIPWREKNQLPEFIGNIDLLRKTT